VASVLSNISSEIDGLARKAGVLAAHSAQPS
jgi:hypothetical protein